MNYCPLVNDCLWTYHQINNFDSDKGLLVQGSKQKVIKVISLNENGDTFK